MRKLLIATHNKGKLREYQALLRGIPFRLTSLAEEGLEIKVEEMGNTYEDNAILKATTYAKASGLITLADDSGLEVDALNGEPGLRSARYGGLGTDEERYWLLLERLKGVPWERRKARFRCIIAIASPRGWVETFEGICEGVITFEPRGTSGFGYDPVFYLPELGCTMAELSPEQKNQISHRAKAARKAKDFLCRLI